MTEYEHHVVIWEKTKSLRHVVEAGIETYDRSPSVIKGTA